MKIALVSGSLRAASFNTSVLRNLEALFPANVECVWIDIDLPLYNNDLDTPDALPAKAATLRQQLLEADGVVVCTPEYNYAIPGTVKNMLDWASRPPGKGVWKNKPVAVIGASPSFTGTARAQQMTKTCFAMAGARLFLDTEVLIANAHERINEEGQITDETTRHFLGHFAELFTAFIDA